MKIGRSDLFKLQFMSVDEKYEACMEACLECSTACDDCATANLREPDLNALGVSMILCRECIEVCYATVRLMRIGGDHASALCNVCAEICEACATECEKHSMDHSQECAAACRRCAEECRAMTEVDA
jgi:Domain of Unknown Function (DUF326)